MTSQIGVAVITHCSKNHLRHCLPSVLGSKLKPRVLVVNSSSHDGTVEEAQRLGAETLVIPRKSFNHGATREFARQHLGTEIVVMMTPDAYPESIDALDKLVVPVIDGAASLAYGRQLPRENAGVLEAFHRYYNYPERSHIRGIDDRDHWGVYSFFFSDCFSAYRNAVLDEVGGFPSVLTAEDTFVAAALLKRRHKIAYVADALVRHSHDYTLLQDLRRHFDTGYVRKQFADILEFGGSDGKRGRDYVSTLQKHLWNEKPSLLPYSWLSVVARLFGYRLGRLGPSLPTWVCRVLSGQDYYWSSDAFLKAEKSEFELLEGGEHK